MILGAGGAGKSTLARRMSQILDVPVVHLDRYYWGPRWAPTPAEDWDRRVVELSAGEAWIQDGNYSRTIGLRLPYAEAAVLVDPPPWTCVARLLTRRVESMRRDRPDLPDDCSDQLSLDFVWWVASYRWRNRPRVLRRLAEHPHVQLTTLRSNRDVERFLESLQSVYVARSAPERPG